MNKITVLSLIELTDEQLDQLRAVSPQLEVHQLPRMPVDDVPVELRDKVEILCAGGRPLEEAHQFPNLKWVQTHSAGINIMLDKPIWHSSVIITNLSGIHPIPMAEHALAMMLAFRWKLLHMFRWQQQSEWPAERWRFFNGPELRGSTLGIVGYGAIGRELARLAQAMGMRVLAVNRSGQRTIDDGYAVPGTGDPDSTIPDEVYPTSKLLAVLPQCDYVVSLLPSTPETDRLFDALAFAQMKQTAYIFNLGRGPVIHEQALIDALRQNEIAGAGLDVFEQEPLPTDSPLWEMDNVIISPHVSGSTPHYDERTTELFAENLRRYLANEPLLNLVEREKGY